MTASSITIERLRACLQPEHFARLDPGARYFVRDPLVHASVLIPIVVRPSGLSVLLTQRTAHLNDHAGQVAFPGGRRDDADAGPVATALREAEEEIGLTADQIEVIGCMPEFCTGTGFRVTPVLALVTPPLNLKLDDFEVAEVFEVPLDAMQVDGFWGRVESEFKGNKAEFWAAHWQQYYVWGATAGMLVNLSTLLRLTRSGD